MEKQVPMLISRVCENEENRILCCTAFCCVEVKFSVDTTRWSNIQIQKKLPTISPFRLQILQFNDNRWIQVARCIIDSLPLSINIHGRMDGRKKSLSQPFAQKLFGFESPPRRLNQRLRQITLHCFHRRSTCSSAPTHAAYFYHKIRIIFISTFAM